MAQADITKQAEIDCDYITCLVCGQELVKSQLIVVGMVSEHHLWAGIPERMCGDAHYKMGCPQCRTSHLLDSDTQPGSATISHIFKSAERRRADLGIKVSASIKKIQRTHGYLDEADLLKAAEKEKQATLGVRTAKG